MKYGQVFRADALAKLTDADLGRLKALGVETVADLRTDFERSLNGPDKVPAGVEVLNVPISDGGMYQKLNEVIASRDPVKQAEALTGGKAEQLLSNAYLKAANDKSKMSLKQAGLMQNPGLLNPLLGVQKQYLDAAFDEVQKQYGSFDRFLRNGLGLDGPTLANLRPQLLTI